MEVTSKRRITVDIRKNNKVAIPSFVQGDTNVVEFEILDNGVAADLSTVGKVVANYKRPDKHVVTREATYAGNIVSYRMGQEEMEVAGLGEVEVQFFNADYSKRVSTFAVRINVAQSVGEAAELSDELGNTLLQDLLVKGDYAEEQAKQAEAAAKTALTNWLSPVANKAAVDAIAGPKLGDTVQTNDNGFVYRYDGTKWVKTQEYGATALANVNAQLADEVQKKNLKGWELQNKFRKRRPIVTFVDDDGRSEVLTKLLPLSKKYNIPFVSALYVQAVEDLSNNRYFNPADAVRLQNDHGWEMSNHTYDHLNLGGLTDTQQEYQLKHAKDVMESWGLNVSTVCYPYDGRNTKTYELTRKYHRAGRRSYGGVNKIPLETYMLRCVAVGSWFDTKTASVPFETDTLEYYKWQVDNAIAENGYLMFMTHCADPNHTATQQQHLDDLIAYVKSKNIEIMTIDQAMDAVGNVVDVGNFNRDDLDSNHFVVGVNGKISASENVANGIIKSNVNKFTAVSLPATFPDNQITSTQITSAGASGLPLNSAGLLITNKMAWTTGQQGWCFQLFHVHASNDIYKRFANTDGTWGEWAKVNTNSMTLAFNSVTATSPITEYKSGFISTCQITTVNASGFPEGKGGTLTTNKISNGATYNYQTYDVVGSNARYKRYATSDTQWGVWQLTSSAVQIAPLNGFSNSSIPNDFVQGVTHCQVTTGNATGLPEAKAGILITNKISASNGYIFQEYHVYDSFNVYKRYYSSAGTWSAWQKLNA